ncbi:hypothetical protein ACTXT7_008910 [Hymenolepis weldensis]
MDCVANEGRPLYVSHQDSVPSHKALKTQNWMHGVGRDVTEKEVNKQPHNTKSSSLLPSFCKESGNPSPKEDISKACSQSLLDSN